MSMDYKKLFDDINSGKLDQTKVQLVMDNDDGYWLGLTDSDEGNSIIEKECKNTYGEPEGYRDIVQVLTSAGVNCDWC